MQLQRPARQQEQHNSLPSAASNCCWNYPQNSAAVFNIALSTGYCSVSIWFNILLNSAYFCINNIWNVVPLESVGENFIENLSGTQSQAEVGAALSVQCLTTDWMTGVWSLAEAKDFSSNQSRPALRPIQWVPGVLSPRVKHSWGLMLTTSIYFWGQE